MFTNKIVTGNYHTQKNKNKNITSTIAEFHTARVPEVNILPTLFHHYLLSTTGSVLIAISRVLSNYNRR